MWFYRRVVRQESPDVVASFSTKSDLIALLGKLLFHLPGQLVVSERADPHTRARHMQAACNALYRWSDAIVCQSQGVAAFYGARLPKANVFVIANPLDENCVAEPMVTERVPTVLAIGRLSEQKNHRLAIRAFRRVRMTHRDLSLKIYGAGPLEEILREFIREEHLEGDVTLEGVHTNVIRKNSRAALFLFTSSHEGYPNALLEAAATGIPVVTTNFSPGTARDLIEEGVNGYIVPVGDEDAVVGAALKALSGDLPPEGLVASARQVRERHHTARIVDAWLSVFRFRDTPSSPS